MQFFSYYCTLLTGVQNRRLSKQMKIRIIGHAGSGKTTLSKDLQTEYDFPSIPLDSFLKQKDKKKRRRNLHNEMNKFDNWVIEGVQEQRWCRQTFTSADLIIVLDYPLYVVQYRVLKRTIIGMHKASKDRKKFLLKRAIALLKWNQRFSKGMPKLKKKLYELNSNLYIIQTPKDIARVNTIIGFYSEEKNKR